MGPVGPAMDLRSGSVMTVVADDMELPLDEPGPRMRLCCTLRRL